VLEGGNETDYDIQKAPIRDISDYKEFPTYPLQPILPFIL
jgi:hypothetical protein